MDVAEATKAEDQSGRVGVLVGSGFAQRQDDPPAMAGRPGDAATARDLLAQALNSAQQLGLAGVERRAPTTQV